MLDFKFLKAAYELAFTKLFKNGTAVCMLDSFIHNPGIFLNGSYVLLT